MYSILINISEFTSHSILGLCCFAGKNETFIEFFSPENRNQQFEDPTVGEFIVKYWGYPVPDVVWYDNYGNHIPWNANKSDDNKFETVLDAIDGLTVLKIKNPNISDCGTYTLNARNLLMEKNISFEFIFQGIIEIIEDSLFLIFSSFRLNFNSKAKPQSDMTWQKDDKKLIVNCTALGNPLARIDWDITDCDLNVKFSEVFI